MGLWPRKPSPLLGLRPILVLRPLPGPGHLLNGMFWVGPARYSPARDVQLVNFLARYLPQRSSQDETAEIASRFLRAAVFMQRYLCPTPARNAGKTGQGLVSDFMLGAGARQLQSRSSVAALVCLRAGGAGVRGCRSQRSGLRARPLGHRHELLSPALGAAAAGRCAAEGTRGDRAGTENRHEQR